ncbi:MAG: hypothetical protein HF962_06895 [Sulfurovum sp.]|nr:hypothetical protein [Sulfurovum sp.]
MSEVIKELLEVEGATVPFFTYQEGETQVYEFDTSECGPPEPMVNAMCGLALIDAPNKRLDMLNHKKPMGLLEKIGQNFNISDEELDGGKFKISFEYKEGETQKANLGSASCGG